MMQYEDVEQNLRQNRHVWLITGVAGFIGSNLLEALLRLDQTVVGLDNFATGHKSNLQDVEQCVDSEQWTRFNFIEGDIRNIDDCMGACKGVDYVLHQAALGSVPRSLADPITTDEVNIGGFLKMLTAARDQKVKNFVYAASSSTYGDHPGLPKVENVIGNPLSPYAVTKYVNELYADVFARSYSFDSIGLRYFNVFGKRQDPNGAYAAVIPKWISAILEEDTVIVNGDGETSRDFCHISNVIQANLLAALATQTEAKNNVYNIAVGDRTSLNKLYEHLKVLIDARVKRKLNHSVTYADFRAGDVRHSLASIEKASELLGYAPKTDVLSGLTSSMSWYMRDGEDSAT